MVAQTAARNTTPNAKSILYPQAKDLDAKYGVRSFSHVEPHTEDISFVELNAIDLGKFKEDNDPQSIKARAELANQLDESLRTQGFFYIVNHGIDDETIDRLHSITQALHEISDEDKLAYRSAGIVSDEDTNTTGAERGMGFKPRRYWGMPNGVRDNIEFYNFSHVVHDETLRKHNHPEIAQAYLNEISNYFQFIHLSVLRKIGSLADIVLKLPDGTFYNKYYAVKQEDVWNSGGGFGRLMRYYGQTEEENEKTADTWLRGHSDSCGFTFIASQPMISLQIRDYKSQEWKYVKHVPGALVVNIGDAVEFLTGGYWRSTIHRVVNPPPSQQGHVRQSIIYFCKPAWNSYIDPEDLNSPHLNELGIKRPEEWEKITYRLWDVEKDRSFGKSKSNAGSAEVPAPIYIRGRLAERWIPASKAQQALKT